jgi:hypothetical protein
MRRDGSLLGDVVLLVILLRLRGLLRAGDKARARLTMFQKNLGMGGARWEEVLRQFPEKEGEKA